MMVIKYENLKKSLDTAEIELELVLVFVFVCEINK